MIESYGHTDLVYHDRPECERAIIVIDGEHGHAPFVAMAGFLKDLEPKAYLLSRFMRQEPLNCLPDLDDPGWAIYEVEGTLVVVIRGFHSPDSTGLSSSTIWAYYYPVLKGLVLALDALGVRSIDVLNSTSVHEFLPDELFTQMDNETIYPYSFQDGAKTKKDIFLHSPVWFTPWLFDKARKGNLSRVTSVGYEERSSGHSVDKVAARTLTTYIQETYRLISDWDYSMEVADEIIEHEQKETDSMSNVYSENSVRKDGNGGVMFG